MTTEQWEPAFPGQRPPFGPGNEINLRHGARSERKIAPRAQAVLDDLMADPSLPSYLHDASYRGALAGLARAEAVVDMLEEYVAGMTLRQSTTGALPVLEQLRKWMATAQSHRRALGLDPLSRATLTKDLVTARATAQAAVAQLAEDGRQTREQS
jgi:hypothetical protein